MFASICACFGMKKKNDQKKKRRKENEGSGLSYYKYFQKLDCIFFIKSKLTKLRCYLQLGHRTKKSWWNRRKRIARNWTD